MAEIVLSEFSRKGEEIYKKRILPEISETALKGKIVAIDVDSGTYFIDDTATGAVLQAHQVFPTKQFYLKRIGYRAVHWHKGVVKKALT